MYVYIIIYILSSSPRRHVRVDGSGSAAQLPGPGRAPMRHVTPSPETRREIFIDNLLVRIHLIIYMIVVDRLCFAPWEFESPFPSDLLSTFPKTSLAHTTSRKALDPQPRNPKPSLRPPTPKPETFPETPNPETRNLP